MTLDDIPLFAMLRGRLGYLSERQRLIAQNVANADTPGYTPQDLKPFTLQGISPGASAPAGTLAPVAPQVTSSMHLAGRGPRSAPVAPFQPVSAEDSETTLNGNGVSLEDEMMKLTEARMNYDAVIGFYQKSLGLLHMAVKKPGS
ncbi:MAG TPA: flagellar basal body rod protein FlgB [Caulobacteraceae bacterium]|nr:flagellar basal body rod protein FlgB [Caulobacteraceae bacterium]